MNTQETLTIMAIVALGLCLLLGLAKMAMKSQKAKQTGDYACNLLVFVAVILLGVSQLLGNKDGFTAPNPHVNTNPNWGIELAKTVNRPELSCINGTGEGAGTDTCDSLGKKNKQYLDLTNTLVNVCPPYRGSHPGGAPSSFNGDMCWLTCCE